LHFTYKFIRETILILPGI